MKISQIIQETTTAGSVAPTEMGFVKMQTRNPSVYGGNKVGNLLKGKKTSKPFANSLNEAAMKDLAYDLQSMKPAEFQKKYGKSREEMKAAMSKQPKPTPPVTEAELQEDDIIVVPGQGRKTKTGFVPHGKSRVDHEVEMARSDLISSSKNAESIYKMIESTSEDEGLEGWVQEKIIKANDYLNTVREYLEGKEVQGVAEGQDQEVTHNGEVIGHTWNQGREVHGEHSKSGMSWAGGNHASMAQHLKNHHDSWVKDQARKQSLKKQGVAEDDAGDVEQRMLGKIEKEKQRLAQLKKTDPEAYQREMEKRKTSSRVPPVSTFEGAKVDRMVKHIEKSEEKAGKSKKEAENIAWATANKRGMLDNKNKKAK